MSVNGIRMLMGGVNGCWGCCCHCWRCWCIFILLYKWSLLEEIEPHLAFHTEYSSREWGVVSYEFLCPYYASRCTTLRVCSRMLSPVTITSDVCDVAVIIVRCGCAMLKLRAHQSSKYWNRKRKKSYLKKLKGKILNIEATQAEAWAHGSRPEDNQARALGRWSPTWRPVRARATLGSAWLGSRLQAEPVTSLTAISFPLTVPSSALEDMNTMFLNVFDQRGGLEKM